MKSKQLYVRDFNQKSAFLDPYLPELIPIEAGCEKQTTGSHLIETRGNESFANCSLTASRLSTNRSFECLCHREVALTRDLSITGPCFDIYHLGMITYDSNNHSFKRKLWILFDVLGMLKFVGSLVVYIRFKQIKKIFIFFYDSTPIYVSFKTRVR